MFEKLFPKERDFFQIFDQISSCLSLSIGELCIAVQTPAHAEKNIEKIKQVESEVDRLARQSIEHLHETFITPFDRVHIFQFVTQLRKITTLVRFVTEKIHFYQIGKLPEETQEIAKRCQEVCQVIRDVIRQLKKLKEHASILNLCLGIHRIRADADSLGLKASLSSFHHESDFKSLIKIREINQDLVTVIQMSERLSFLIEEIVLEYA